MSVIQIVKRVLENFDPRTIQSYDLEISIPETLMVQADEQYLRQVLRNLLSNAFNSSSVRGIGLGLYINKQLVEAMGGEIWVESSGIVEQGSQFCFTLPLAAATITHEHVEQLPPSKV